MQDFSVHILRVLMISQSSHTLGVRGLGVDSMEIIYGGKLARENESLECEASAGVRWHYIKFS